MQKAAIKPHISDVLFIRNLILSKKLTQVVLICNFL